MVGNPQLPFLPTTDTKHYSLKRNEAVGRNGTATKYVRGIVMVIDASALIRYILHEGGWDQISGYLRVRRPLYSVDHILEECSSAIWKHYYIRKLVDADTALNVFKKLMKVVDAQVIVIEQEGTYLERALDISLSSGLPVCDALYMAQVEKYGGDTHIRWKQARMARSLGVEVHYVE